MSSNTGAIRQRNRTFLIAVIILFSIPPLAAWLLIDVWRPGGTVEHGQLLSPAQPLPPLQGQTLAGEPAEQKLLGHWNMTYVSANGQCDSVCQQDLYHIRQMHIALGRDMDRAQAVLLMSQTPDQDFADLLEQEHPTMLKILLDNQQTTQFITDTFAVTADAGGIYLIDPYGNLFMRYDSGTIPGDMLKDLKRLLKYSRLG